MQTKNLLMCFKSNLVTKNSRILWMWPICFCIPNLNIVIPVRRNGRKPSWLWWTEKFIYAQTQTSKKNLFPGHKIHQTKFHTRSIHCLFCLFCYAHMGLNNLSSQCKFSWLYLCWVVHMANFQRFKTLFKGTKYISILFLTYDHVRND